MVSRKKFSAKTLNVKHCFQSSLDFENQVFTLSSRIPKDSCTNLENLMSNCQNFWKTLMHWIILKMAGNLFREGFFPLDPLRDSKKCSKLNIIRSLCEYHAIRRDPSEDSKRKALRQLSHRLETSNLESYSSAGIRLKSFLFDLLLPASDRRFSWSSLR